MIIPGGEFAMYRLRNIMTFASQNNFHVIQWDYNYTAKLSIAFANVIRTEKFIAYKRKPASEITLNLIRIILPNQLLPRSLSISSSDFQNTATCIFVPIATQRVANTQNNRTTIARQRSYKHASLIEEGVFNGVLAKWL
jgi:hypothetical protein